MKADLPGRRLPRIRTEPVSFLLILEAQDTYGKENYRKAD